MLTSTMCGHCHKMIPVSQRYCGNCGHAAGSRLSCDCPRCRPALVQLGNDVVDLARDDDDLIDLAHMED